MVEIPKSKPLPKTIPAKPDIDRFAEEAVEQKKTFESDRKPYEPSWEKAVTYYEMRTPPRKFDWQCDAFLPIIYRDFRTIFPRIKKQVIGPIPLIKLIGKNSSAEEKAIAYYFRKARSYLAASDILHECLLYGTGIGKLIPDIEYQYVYRKVPKITPGQGLIDRIMRSKQGRGETEEYDEIQEIIERCKRPRLYYCPLLCIFTNANDTDSIDDADIYEERYVDLNWFRQRSKDKRINPHGWKTGIYDNVDKIEEIEAVDFAEDPQQNIRNIRGETTFGDDSRKKKYRLLTRQGDFTFKGTFYRNGVADIAQVRSKDTHTRNITLRVMACPRSDGKKNYLRVVYERVPGRFYGRSLVDGLLRIQEIANDFFRAQMDRDTLALHKPLGYNANVVDDPGLLHLRMGGLIPCNAPPAETLYEFKIDPTHPGSWRVSEYLSQMGIETSGAHKNMAGTSEGSLNRTASGIMALIKEGNERLIDTARDMTEEFITDLGEGYHCLIKYMFDETQELTYVNNKGDSELIKLDPQSLGDEIDVYAPTIFERADRQQQAQGMLQLLQYIAGQIGPEALLEISKTIWEYMELPDAEKIFIPDQQSIPLEIVTQILSEIDPRLQQEFARRLAEKAQQQAQGGGKGQSSQGGRQAPNVKQSRTQGSATTAMPFNSSNTGGRV